ncbi:hypothetical protein C8Z91_27605 [Paenibacillus elgii]|uniref:Uncharacterized protein n=1 Tax=Paenibacillus elgii TaxID=189691 RepID=A0A2T6FWE2_9BACL|nr:hypothetical protein C8Z91_27605 [Paenibacillus elgii]
MWGFFQTDDQEVDRRGNDEEMISFLVDKGRHFKKPLIGNATELFLDQFPAAVNFLSVNARSIAA